jgi:CBS domain containing-hemolysin-like protein
LKVNLRDFIELVDVDEDLFEEKREEAETLAGFILEISEISQPRDKNKFTNCLFTVEMVDKSRSNK